MTERAEPRPRRARGLRLLYLLLALPLPLFVHQIRVLQNGEASAVWACTRCGALMTRTEHRLFASIPICQSTGRIEDTACARILRDEYGFECERHAWRPSHRWEGGRCEDLTGRDLGQELSSWEGPRGVRVHANCTEHAEDTRCVIALFLDEALARRMAKKHGLRPPAELVHRVGVWMSWLTQSDFPGGR